jgi:hypothetical protein
VPWGTPASRCWEICDSSWCAIRTPAGWQSAAARRHSVTPPHSEASTFTKSTAPASSSRRTPWLVISLWPAVTGIRVALRTRAIIAASSYQWHGSSNQAMPSGSMRRANRTASSTDQAQLASTASTKSSPAARRAASTRRASSSGASPPTLNLHPAMPAAR